VISLPKSAERYLLKGGVCGGRTDFPLPRKQYVLDEDAICNGDAVCEACLTHERLERNVCMIAFPDFCVDCSVADDPLS
jgi:hypothetical protein